MGNVMMQIIGDDGRIEKEMIEWSDERKMIDAIDKVIDTINNLPDDLIVFLVIDLYSTHKSRKETKAEKIVREQVEAVEKKQEKEVVVQSGLFQESE